MSEFKKRIDSFKYALNGFKILFKEEFNAKVHLVSAILALILGFLFDLNTFEWIAILLAIAMVISSELINTAIEYLANFVSPEKRTVIKKVKDLAAAAVLTAAIVALFIGIIIFGTKILTLI
ncbi:MULTISPECIES: diacylglycerol kinase family protein [Sphingobacterium]|uniref:diacylglycerol kinase family protein n=1 Tax=Sphingobacterium TaxID=28453 RepID=UPI0013DA0845|nr:MULTISPECIES: diacylglycerol kinase family protein [unclassified Sphingobacterium]